MTAPVTGKGVQISCADIVPECPFTANAATEEELLSKVVALAAHDHGITEVTPELAARVKAAKGGTRPHPRNCRWPRVRTN